METNPIVNALASGCLFFICIRLNETTVKLLAVVFLCRLSSVMSGATYKYFIARAEMAICTCDFTVVIWKL